MHYKCKNCSYEFDVYNPPHPHQGMFITIVGCPVCQRAQAMSKVCPKCKSIRLEQSLTIKKEE